MSIDVASVAMRRPRPWLTSTIGLLLALGGIALPFGTWDHASASIGHMAANELVYGGLVAAVLGYVLWIERRPLASIGFKMPGRQDILVALVAGIVLIALLAVIYLVVFPALHWDETQQLRKLLVVPFWLRFISVVRAAVSEEILFRGYAIERVQELTGSRVAAGMFTWAIFTLEHVSYWGWHHLLVAGAGGAVLTALYLWRRNLWGNMLAHFMVDAAGFLAG